VYIRKAPYSKSSTALYLGDQITPSKNFYESFLRHFFSKKWQRIPRVLASLLLLKQFYKKVSKSYIQIKKNVVKYIRKKFEHRRRRKGEKNEKALSGQDKGRIRA
jgi:hypothetical protein